MTRVVAWAPGRLNLIGDHTDYNGGLALPLPVAQGVRVVAEAADGDEIRVTSVLLGEEDSFAATEPDPATGWRAYPRGVVGELAAGGVRVPAARVRIESDLPAGGGLASSAALCVALSLALLELARAPRVDDLDLARLCARVENDWAGAQTGLLDQLAILGARADRALRIDFSEVATTSFKYGLRGWRLALAASGAGHEHSGETGYNERRAECRRACDALGIDALAHAAAVDVAGLPEPLDRRARHVLEEDMRVEAAHEALRTRRPERLGGLLDSSHASLRDLYDASTPEVEDTVRRLKEAGAAGARMTGGGFGGSVLALFDQRAEMPGWATEVRPGAGPWVRLTD